MLSGITWKRLLFIATVYDFLFQDIRYVGKDELEIFLQEQKMKNCRFNGIAPWFNLIATSMLPTWWENIDNLESLKDHTKIMKFEWY